MPFILPDHLRTEIAATRARIRVGFPFWLAPFLSRDVAAITLGRSIFVSPAAGERPASEVERLLVHELVHVRQVIRLGIVRFLWRYLAEYLRGRRRGLSAAAAYRAISFEIEAFAEEGRPPGGV